MFLFFIFFSVFFFFFFKQKTAYEISACLVGSEMCIRDSYSQMLRRCQFQWKFLGSAALAFLESHDCQDLLAGSGIAVRRTVLKDPCLVQRAEHCVHRQVVRLRAQTAPAPQWDVFWNSASNNWSHLCVQPNEHAHPHRVRLTLQQLLPTVPDCNS